MGSLYVCNASPLILLARIGSLHLLPRLADSILIPQTVMREIEAGNRIDGAADAVRAEPALQRNSPSDTPYSIAWKGMEPVQNHTG